MSAGCCGLSLCWLCVSAAVVVVAGNPRWTNGSRSIEACSWHSLGT